MPHLECGPSEYLFPTPKNGSGTPSSMESFPPNAVSPDVKPTSNIVLQNQHQVKGIQLTLTYGPRTFAEHIAHQKDLCKMRRNKSALGKATIAYCQQKFSWALDDEMCNALDEYEKLPKNAKSRRQFMSADISMLLIFWSMLPQLHQLPSVKVLLTLTRTHSKVYQGLMSLM